MALSDDGLPDLHHTTRARTILPFCLTTRQHSSSLTGAGPDREAPLKAITFHSFNGNKFPATVFDRRRRVKVLKISLETSFLRCCPRSQK
jgi:hypothetical protein